MKKLKLNLENCFGIEKLDYTFDFQIYDYESPPNIKEEKKVIALYAQNGTMKSSFAKTLDLYSKDKTKEIKDRIFNKETKFTINDHTDKPFDPKDIYVVGSSIDKYNNQEPEEMTALLVDKDLKEEYDSINLNITKKQKTLITQLKKSSGLKTKTETILINDILIPNKNLLESLLSLEEKISENYNKDLSNIEYGVILNDKTESFLNKPNVESHLSKYVERYNDLIEESTLFEKGVFDNYNAKQVRKTIDDHSFLNEETKHTLSLSGFETIENIEKFDTIVNSEKMRIFNDEDVLKAFDEFNAVIDANKEIIALKKELSKHEFLIPLLVENREKLKMDFWIAYLSKHKTHYDELMTAFKDSKNKIKEILEKANKENKKTIWEEIIDDFNARFYVPFTLDIEDREDAILGITAPSLIFKFEDQKLNGGKKQLIEVLSQGEKRAFYLLNLLFEIRALKENGLRPLLIIDDIADSFDYQNKYAIIEYLKELTEEHSFKMIILTHNFDFYRAITSRLNIHRSHNLFALKTNSQIEIKNARYTGNVFTTWTSWVKRVFQHIKEPEKNYIINNQLTKILIALIPFARNIEEYTSKDTESEDCPYKFYTQLLHIKEDKTPNIKLGELETHLFQSIDALKKTIPYSFIEDMGLSKDTSVLAHLYNEADSITESDDLLLENKIVLSLACRLKAEEFMIEKIKQDSKIDNSKIERIKKNQTRELYKLYNSSSLKDQEAIKILKKINIITPENIHINSFMYEPLLDVSCNSLMDLLKEIKEIHQLPTSSTPN